MCRCFDMDCVPNDHSRQVSSLYYADLVLRQGSIRVILDLGCGSGGSRDYFCQISPGIQWFGLDIVSSPEVDARPGQVENLVAYDGVHIPFRDSSLDLIYSHQVMEHVRYPESVLKEARRTLRPGGYFIGSTSHLEPYHSNSYWNFTPWGFCELLETAGFKVVEVRPGIDALTLITRSILRKPKCFDSFFENESPFNRLIGMMGRVFGKSHISINRAKLSYAGHFCFLAVKT